MAEETGRSVTLYSYRKVWFVENRIYSVQNIPLPFPVNPYELAEFGAVAGIVFLLGRIFPAVQNIPFILRYLALPYIIVKYLMKLKLDGKNPLKFFLRLLPYLLHKNFYMEHFSMYRETAGKTKINWFCSKG